MKDKYKWLIGIAVIGVFVFLLTQVNFKNLEGLNYSWKPLETSNTFTEGTAY